MSDSDLVKKVATAIENAEAQNVHGFIYPDIAKAAIATVLGEMIGGGLLSNEETIRAWEKSMGCTIDIDDARSIEAMLRAFAAEHGIALAPSGEGEGK